MLYTFMFAAGCLSFLLIFAANEIDKSINRNGDVHCGEEEKKKSK